MDIIDVTKNAIEVSVLKELTVTEENFTHAQQCKMALPRVSARSTTNNE